MVPHDVVYDLLILTDATASMDHYLRGLSKALPDIIRISALTSCFQNIGVLAYRDYNKGDVLEWSGWYGQHGTTSRSSLINMVSRLVPEHGGDWPEASKTGFAKAYEVMRAEAKTLILLYTDAPPHMPATGGSNREEERKALSDKTKFGGYGHLFLDWISVTYTLTHGKKKAQVFAIIQSHLMDTLSPYLYLTNSTQGLCLRLDSFFVNDNFIAELTIGLLINWMGVEKAGTAPDSRQRAKLVRYKSLDGIETLSSETGKNIDHFLLLKDTKEYEQRVRENTSQRDISLEELKSEIILRDPPMLDFSKNYQADAEYRKVVVDQLRNIIDTNVATITRNPVFGSLWRTMCSDRENEDREKLLAAFSQKVDMMADTDKAKLKAWLEESYNYTTEIVDTIRAVPKDERFPCVYLDPTVDFGLASEENGTEGNIVAGDGDNEDEKKQIKWFTRDELLEIGRSCDFRILRRLGKVLTRLTYVDKEEDIPMHIKNMPEEEVPRLPLALASLKHKRRFWKILLHLIVPGTMLAARPAALLAALSLWMGMKSLTRVADIEMLYFKKGWNNIDTPEIWNKNCLFLVLETDQNYRARVEASTAKADLNEAFLTDKDRKLFNTLVDYRILEMNLDTTLQVKVGWTPEKTRVPVGPVVTCRVCHFPRSVTIMGKANVCGMCDKNSCDCLNQEVHNKRLKLSVSEKDDEETEIAWVECYIPSCRAQYVIYDKDSLNVRAKCHFCRQQSKVSKEQQNSDLAPWLECVKCLSRVIWPEEYRPSEGVTEFHCPACTDSRKTIVEVETTARKLSKNNGIDWILRNDDIKIAEPFNGRSLFHTISTAGTEGFTDKVEILPDLQSDTISLNIRGKLVRNKLELSATLQTWINRRTAQPSTCNLCFTTYRKRDLRPVCNRSGCNQRICRGCLGDWYGLNKRGKIINVAALFCPFCRRRPTAKTVSSFGLVNNINFLGDLATAVAESGEWVYAWCWGCGFAKRLGVRDCAAGPPAEVSRWSCVECWTKGKFKFRATIKPCPGCKTPTEKMGGCDHVSCVIPGCGTNWCFYCGMMVSMDDIYAHMYKHGGFYATELENASVEGWMISSATAQV